MKRCAIAFIGLLFIACGTAREKDAADVADLELKPEEDTLLTQLDAMFKTVEAKVIYEPFINKAGKLIEGSGDYFLEYDNQKWFIKFSSGTVLRDDVAKLKDQTAKFSIAELEGLWDTDNPEVQSRIGKYVAVYAIIP